MFDAETAALLRSAPEVPGLDPSDLPALLTYHYANLASARLGGLEENPDDSAETWSLERVADTYELVASLESNAELRRAASFVAGTAQQIIARRQAGKPLDPTACNIDRDRLDPSLSAPLLFLAAEQFADANEATSAIVLEKDGQIYEATIVSEHIADLARGRLLSIIDRSNRWRRPRDYSDIEDAALAALMEALATGIEIFAADLLRLDRPEPVSGRFELARVAFEQVITLSAARPEMRFSEVPVTIIYAGPHHLASLLLTATEAMRHSGLPSVPPPAGSDREIWQNWLQFRARLFPYIWPNHREAISQGFYETGVSAVVVLPTGAGKTTVSSLKIAGVLARGKKVVFLAPTHALVEQLTEDLQEMFPTDLMGSVVSNDFDLLLQEDAKIRDVEVMTPERCLAMLSFAPDAFTDVGLLVFDECHLLSPESGKIRRALDGMLCVLGFNHIAPDADLLFLSAMVKNGKQLSEWLASLTGRTSVSVDLLWKPSRQARGVLIYDAAELNSATASAIEIQQGENERLKKKAVSLRQSAKDSLKARPYAIWGLQHNWLGEKEAFCSTTPLLLDQVLLAGKLAYGPSVRLTPNANGVAAKIAAVAANQDLKTIVFVNTKNDAVKVANDVAALVEHIVTPTDAEALRWTALEAELGGLRHSLLKGPAAAVAHNSAMLRLERELAERMFKRTDGAKVIVATPTLAQGLNLPAHLAILAGDKRAGLMGGRESLEAHEILNAAARAGRAGHLANGLVLLVPEPLISFEEQGNLSAQVVEKLKSVLPEDDHCVTISDPLEIVLDRVMGGQLTDPEVKYTINRMAVLQSVTSGEEAQQLFDLRRSLSAHIAHQRNVMESFNAKIEKLKQTIDAQALGIVEDNIAVLASQSGLSVQVIMNLKARLLVSVGDFPISIEGWLKWTIEWLSEDESARNELLSDTKPGIMTACGKTEDGEISIDQLRQVLAGLVAWIGGVPLVGIENILGGDPTSEAITKRTCPRARALISSVIPRGISFVLGLVSHVVEEIDPYDQQDTLDQQMVECLSSAVRKGFDSTEKLFFAAEDRDVLCRVQGHLLWNQQALSS